MTKNIFEGAKFGDMFVCRNGMQAVLFSYELITPEPSPTQVNTICLCVEDGYMNSEYNIDGTLPYDNVSEYEIVSRYQEPIDEDKLDELAKDFAYNEVASKYEETFHKPYPGDRENFGFISCEKSYKAGYRSAFNNKAMEE